MASSKQAGLGQDAALVPGSGARAEHCPHLLKGEDEAGDVGKKGKRGGGVIKKKTISADKQKVIISKEVRNKKKAVTSVEGLETFSVKLKDAAKVFGQKFAASSSVNPSQSLSSPSQSSGSVPGATSPTQDGPKSPHSQVPC